jgi:alkylation response protein AidB-like acyl-CoA dehydrogenase
MAQGFGDFQDFHDELRAVAGDLLGKAPGSPPAWELLAQAGWTGLEVPEEFGGAGATFGETAIICEEIGRAAAATAFLGSAVLGVGALNMVAPHPVRDQLLAGTAAGELRVAVALSADHESICDAPAFALSRTVDGRSDFLVDAPGADRLLLLARDGDGVPVLVAVPATAPGLTVADQPVLDETRRFAVVTADAVAAADCAVLRFTGDPVGQLRALEDRACVAVACDSLGLSEAMLAATVEYAGVRQQFGRPIGSFQAVKHACADMLVQISVARQLVSAAVDAVAQGADAARPASMAKSYACEVAIAVAGKAMQLHGGIGYTWESGIHVYLKRATLNRSLFGSPAAHRRRLSG